MNEQQQFWAGEEGNRYIERNKNYVDIQYEKGTKSSIFRSFFEDLPRDMSILEIGCNTGNNIEILKEMGFKDITGLDINLKAINLVREKYPEFTFINSSLEDYPITKKFDLVYTCGVLIHIHPNNLQNVIDKIKSLSNKYIFGMEYYDEITTQIKYRNKDVLCWKGNYADMFGMTPSRIEICKRVEGKDCFYLFSL